MSMQQMLLTSGERLLTVDSADFDGTNDYMTRTTLVGAADSKSGILSYWVRIDSNVDFARALVINTAANAIRFISFTRGTIAGGGDVDGQIGIWGRNSAGTQILKIGTASAPSASATWLHFLASWDLAASTARVYLNDVQDETITTLTDDLVDYTVDGPAVGAGPTGGLKLNGVLAEVYFALGQYLDFSIVSNRRKFLSAGGKPVFLGADGSLPTGTAPIIYQHLDDGEAVANFATNRGTGGDFTITGTLDTGSTSPSD